jgi:hydroxymethylpyrimidine pyrophosphatase-like HAD family hydrolase
MKVRWAALACDYDGTLAYHGRVRGSTLAALRRLRHSRRKLVLVTGRELDPLRAIFPGISLFDRVVAENGALIFDPAARASRVLADRPPAAFIHALQAHQVAPLSIGRSIVATDRGQRAVVAEVTAELGLPLDLILNKDALMVLPRGVSKASGLLSALREIGVAAADTVGIGDAENDEGFLALCGCSAAVANALPRLKRKVDVVTSARQGAGVVELVDHLLNGSLPRRRPARELRN